MEPTVQKAWRLGTACIASGDQHTALTIRGYAAAGLSDAEIARRTCDIVPNANNDRRDAAITLARHGGVVGCSAGRIVEWLARLACEVPCWSDDPDEIAAIVRTAVVEFGQ